MLQNPLKPFLAHGLGSLQVVDILFPVMLIWMAWYLWFQAQSGGLHRQLSEHRVVMVLAGVLIVAFLLGGIGAGYSPRLLDLTKYGYLVGILLFFMLALHSKSAVFLVFRVLVYASIGYMVISLCYYLAAYFYGYSSNFSQIREGFPYLGKVVRLNGPMQPTSKIFGMYILMLSLLLMQGRHILDLRIWRLAIVLSILCGLLTLGRVGVTAVAAVIFGIAALSANRGLWLTLIALPMLIASIGIQLLTIWHVDIAHAVWSCDVDYAIEKPTQYFGWYSEPTMCRFTFDSAVTYSSYFLMKLVAWKAWLSHPFFGIGVYQYVDAWRAAVGVDIPSYFKDHPFTMAQSTYLTLLAEVGLFGVAAWFSLIGVFLWRIWSGLRENIATRWMFQAWFICFAYAMIDLDVQNFRFLYSLIPLAAMMSLHSATQIMHAEVRMEQKGS